MNSAGYKPMYDSRCELPVFEFKSQLLNMIKENNVILVKGETGCGKTTQVSIRYGIIKDNIFVIAFRIEEKRSLYFVCRT